MRRLLVAAVLAAASLGLSSGTAAADGLTVAGDCFGGSDGGFCSVDGTDYICDSVIPGSPGMGMGCSVI